MKKVISVALFSLILVGSPVIAGQITIEVENKTKLDVRDPRELAVIQYPQQGKMPYLRIKEVFLAPGQKGSFHYEWNDRDINSEMNIDIAHLTDGNRICNLRIYPTDEGGLRDLRIENIWFPDFPYLNKYICESKYTKDGRYVVIKNK